MAQKSSPIGGAEPKSPDPDLTLDILGPLLSSSGGQWSAAQATAARERLDKAIAGNKSKTHSLLLENYATISSHIQISESLGERHEQITSRLSSLQGEIDINPNTSFLPPVIKSLDRYFQAKSRKERAEAHGWALKVLEEKAGFVGRLEDAIWEGRGAEDWVVDALAGGTGGANGVEVLGRGPHEGVTGHGMAGIEGTRIATAMDTRIQLYKSMALEQLSEAFNQAISLTTKNGKETILAVKVEIKLQKPKIPLAHSPSSQPSQSASFPPIPLPVLLSTLSTLSILPSLLSSLSTRLLRDIVGSLLSEGSTLRLTTIEDGKNDHILHLSPSGPQSSKSPMAPPTRPSSPADKITDIRSFLNFISTTLFPLPQSPNPALISTRSKFLSDLTSSTLSSLLAVLTSTMPPSLAEIPNWLELLNTASTLESDFTPGESTSKASMVIRNFVAEEAGTYFVKSRARAAVEEVKILVGRGWGGWDAMEVKREIGIEVMVEEEVEEDEDVVKGDGDGRMEVDEPEEDGWGLDSPIATTHEVPGVGGDDKAAGAEVEVTGEEDAWGFDDDAGVAESSIPPTAASVSASASTSISAINEESDGWDFDTPSQPPVATVSSPAKPVREAKKLGKRVAKAKQAAVVEEEDTVMTDGGAEESVGRGNDWGWDEPKSEVQASSISTSTQPLADPTPVKRRRIVLRKEQKVVVETYLVSKSCETLLGLVERCLDESKQMEESSLPTSFTSPHSHLRQTALSLLDTFRALIPQSTTQIKDVPTLSFQLSNDFYYLSTRLSSSPTDSLSSPPPSSSLSDPPTLGDKYNLPPSLLSDTSRRLLAASSHIFESTLESQRRGLMGLLDEAQGWEGTGLVAGSKRCEGVMRGVEERLGSLGRVTKVVLPPSSFYPMMGYLIDTVVSRISTEILSLADITEVESEKLEELLRVLRPLESVFEGAEPPTSILAHTPHWLKYQYISELLRANLVDITYLFDTGALVDFTTEELVSVLKALFADSENRDRAIERIERGREGGGEGGQGGQGGQGGNGGV